MGPELAGCRLVKCQAKGGLRWGVIDEGLAKTVQEMRDQGDAGVLDHGSELSA